MFPLPHLKRITTSICSAILLSSILATSNALAETSSKAESLDALRRATTALDKEKAISEETKKSLKHLLSTLTSAQGVPAREKEDAILDNLSDIASRIDIFSDFRARHETDWREELDNRNRERVRFRLGATYEVDPGVSVEARLVTGNSDDPNSIHQTLGNVNDSFFFTLDRVNLKYAPEFLPGSSVQIGKFARTFKTSPIFGELAWDGDVQPEGAAVKYAVSDLGPLSALYLTAGEYLVLTQDRAEEATQFDLQVAAEAKLAENLSLLSAVGWTDYQRITPDGSTAVLGDNAGNAVVDVDGDGVADEFLSDFSILHPLLSLTYTGWDLPLSISTEYIVNLEAKENDTAWALGASIGRAKLAGEWKLYYQWQVVEQDAVFSAFAQDDFVFQTNYRTHAAGGKYQLSDRIGLHVYAFISELDVGKKTDEIRGRVDLNVALF